MSVSEMTLLPLAGGQHGLWLAHQRTPDAVQNTVTAFEIVGAVDPAELERAFKQLVDRHEALRSCFVEKNGEPYRVVTPALSWQLEKHEFGDRAELENHCRIAAGERFDLSAAPLFRFQLLRLDESHHRLLLVASHLLLDGWSWRVLFSELGELYGQSDSPLSVLGQSYGEAVEAERALIAANESSDLDYWQQTISGLQPLDLPSDRPRPTEPSYQIEQVLLPLDDKLAAAINVVARRALSTPYAFFLAAFWFLLGELSGSDDIAVGALTAGQPYLKGSEQVVGMFVNAVTLRGDLNKKVTFADLVGQARDVTFAAIEHHALPFERVAALLESRQPFQALFQFEELNAPLLHGLQTSPCIIAMPTDSWELSLAAFQRGRTIDLALNYSTDLFDRVTAERMLRRYLVVLTAAVSNTDKRLGELSLMEEGEIDLIAGWERGEHHASDETLRSLLERQISAQPESVALVSESESLSYGELDRRAESLAAQLRAAGVGHGDLVGLAMRRSVEFVVSVLAVLKLGAAYVPLDPDYPPARLQMMAEACSLGIVLATDASDALPSFPFFLVSTNSTLDPVQLATPTAVSGDDIAVVLFTSGSTGAPKPVALSHCGLANCIEHVLRTRKITADDSSLTVYSPSFDGHLIDLFVTLGGGARLAIVPREASSSPISFVEELHRNNVTVSDIPAALWHAWMELDDPPVPPMSLRSLTVAGDRMDLTLAEVWRRLSAAELINAYGPTEASITISEHLVQPGEVPSIIGRPYSNCSLHVLDERLERLPVGVPGELYIGGVQLAQSYLGRPEVTAAAFIPNPFGPGRLYRTGDWVRWRDDGTLEFCGRRDDQVKIRGYRIEPREIENLIRAQPEVSDAAVIVVDDELGGKRLAAYVVGPDDSGQLRSVLSAQLPAYMVPALITTVDEIPRTSIGKVDRGRLLLSETLADHGEDLNYVAPQGELEQLVASIFEELLSISPVGANDDFFSIGGHSLFASLLSSRLQRELGRGLPMIEIFRNSTPRALAAAIHRQQALTGPTLGAAGDEPAALSYPQEQLWYLNEIEPDNRHHVALAWRIKGPFDAGQLEKALTALAERHEPLRSRYLLVDGQPRQEVSPPGAPPFSLIDGHGMSEDALLELARAETERPFDLSTGPLWRSALVEVDREEHLLLVTAHHSVADGASTALIAAELTALYDGKELEPLPFRYRDFAVWQRENLVEQKDSLDYWTKQLRGVPELGLATIGPRPAVTGFIGSHHPFLLGQETADAVERLCQKEQITPFMLLLAVFQCVLGRYCDQDDFAVGSPVAARGQAGSERVVGMFANMLALRADLSGDPTFRELLARVSESCIEAYAHQDLPFSTIVAAVGESGREAGARTPLFQVMFSYTDGRGILPRFDGCTTAAIDPGYSYTPHELALTIERNETGYSGRLVFNTALYNKTVAEGLSEAFSRLLHALLDDLDLPIDATTLSGREGALLALGRGPVSSGERPVSVARMIEQQAASHPDAVAVDDQGQLLTYGQLDRQASILARWLLGEGIGTESVVACLLERSRELAVVFLAVLKAGAVYLPLDPSNPQERNVAALAESQAALLIRQPHLHADGAAAELVVDDLLRQDGEPLSSLDPETHSLAYIIFTSGSTGTPKGVAVSQASFSESLAYHQERVSVGPEDTIELSLGIGFDGALLQLALGLSSGCRLIVPPSLGPGVHELPSDPRATAIFAVPSIVAAVNQEDQPNVRTIIVGGEHYERDLARRWSDNGGRFFNSFGATETAIAVTAELDDGSLQRAPIGLPFAGSAIYIVDDNFQPVPVGVPGEIAIAGGQLARGYLARPALTAERFIPNPFATRRGERLYMTGDLGRWSIVDGSLELLGRRDRQLKLRGVRIEPGEVEHALNRHPAVTQSVVTVKEVQGSPRLVAYYIPSGQAVNAAELTAHMRRFLAGHSCPSFFIPCERFPQGASGKIDSDALPEPETILSGGLPSRQPQGEREESVAHVFMELLGLEEIGADDDFFALGGDSISSVRAIAMLATRCLHLTPPIFLSAPTVAELAKVAASSPTSVANPDGRTLGLTVSQTKFLREYVPSAQSPDRYQAGETFALDPAVDLDMLELAAAAVVAGHPGLRACFPSADEQLILPIERCRFMHRVSASSESELLAAIAAVQSQLSIIDGPLAAIIIAEGDVNYLSILVNHLVFDAYSLTVILEDLAASYAAMNEGRQLRLPADDGLVDCLQQMKLRAAHATIDPDLVAGLPLTAPLPRDFVPSGIVDYTTMKIQRYGLDEELSARLISRGASTVDVFLAALARIQARWTGQPQAVISILHGGRDLADDLSRTAAWIETEAPVVLHADCDASQAALARSRSLGYSLRRLLADDAEAQALFDAHPHMFEMRFNYLGRLGEGLPFGRPIDIGVEYRFLEERIRSILDIQVTIEEGTVYVQWYYNTRLHCDETIDNVHDRLLVELERLLA